MLSYGRGSTLLTERENLEVSPSCGFVLTSPTTSVTQRIKFAPTQWDLWAEGPLFHHGCAMASLDHL